MSTVRTLIITPKTITVFEIGDRHIYGGYLAYLKPRKNA